MKVFLSFVVLCMMSTTTAVSQNLDSLLKAVYVSDQTVRKDFMRVFAQQPMLPDSVIAADARMRQVDAENQRIVFGMLDQQGWPSGLSEEANKAIWIVIDHAGQEDLKRYLPLVAQQTKAGVVSESLYATMLDRMLMRDGLRQRYGTQTVSSTVDGVTQVYVWPVEDARTLDEERAKIGLPPMSEYVKLIGESCGTEVVWNPKLEIGDMPEHYPQP